MECSAIGVLTRYLLERCSRSSALYHVQSRVKRAGTGEQDIIIGQRFVQFNSSFGVHLHRIPIVLSS